MSCISTNLSGSQEDTLCSSPPCVCSLAHFPLYCFMSLYRISNASVHLGPFGCVQRNGFLSNTHTPTHRELDPGAAPICAFLSFLSTLPLIFLLSLYLLFLTAIRFALSFCSSFPFLAPRGERQRHGETEAGIVQADVVGLVHYRCCSNIKVSPPVTDSVRRGSA